LTAVNPDAFLSEPVAEFVLEAIFFVVIKGFKATFRRQ